LKVNIARPEADYRVSDPNAETSKQTSHALRQQIILLLQTFRNVFDRFASMRRGLSFRENLPCALALQTKRLSSVALPQQLTEKVARMGTGGNSPH
jgi:hypothetical protein